MNPTQLGAVRTLLLAKAHEATVRAAMAPIFAEAMARWKPTIAPERRHCRDAGTLLTTWDSLYLTDDATFADIQADVRKMTQERHPALVTKDPEHCPVLEAENLTMLAERAVVLAFQGFTPGKTLTWDDLICHGLDTLRKYIDLHVRLAVSLYPRHFDAATVLGRRFA